MKKVFFVFVSLVTFYISNAQIVNFENFTLSGVNSAWDNTVSGASFSLDGVNFKQYFSSGYWDSGFTYSNINNTTTPGFTNDKAAITGNGFQNSSVYAVAYNSGSKITFDSPRSISGFYFTNSTYSYLSMKNGDAFAKKFGGVSGNDPDYFRVKVQGFQSGLLNTNTGIDFYLADFRFGINSQDYIVKDWRWFSLTALGVVDSLSFTFESSDVGGFGINTPKYFAIDNFNGVPPIITTNPIIIYDSQVEFGSINAVFKDDSRIKSWAINCTVQRGWIDISNKQLGRASFGLAENATGKSDGKLVSLGDSGVAILTFSSPIKNGTGADFAVFENGFLLNQGAGLAYLELAHVDVSSDGTNYYRFPSTSNIQNTTQLGGFDYIDAKQINNLAGKYIANYGTPFDLEELKNKQGLDVNNITHIKITDVTGSISQLYANYDAQNNIINDPFATAFTSSGFDLEAVAVLNQVAENSLLVDLEKNSHFYPTILHSGEKIHITNSEIEAIKITNLLGVSQNFVVENNEVTLIDYQSGMYIVSYTIQNKYYNNRIVVK